MKILNACVAAMLLCVGGLLWPQAVCGADAPAAPLKLLSAGFWGTAEDDDLEGAAQAPDGTVYLVGNVGTAAKNLPNRVVPHVYGQPQPEPKCGRAFVAHLSGDMTKLLDYAELADGIAQCTTVQVTAQGVYVGGYASQGLEPLLQDKPAMMAKYPLAAEARLVQEGKILEATGLKDQDPL